MKTLYGDFILLSPWDHLLNDIEQTTCQGLQLLKISESGGIYPGMYRTYTAAIPGRSAPLT
jgi:hypothetical protein